MKETNDLLDTIARDVGFADAMRMRDAFVRIFGFSPQEMRRGARLDIHVDNRIIAAIASLLA